MEYQQDPQPVEHTTETRKQVKRYLIPVLAISLVIVFFSVIGYICFSTPNQPEKITVTIDDMTIAKEPLPEDQPTIIEEPSIKVVVSEEVAPLEMTTTETIKTDYSKIEIPETVAPAPVEPQPVVVQPKPVVKKTTPAVSKPKPALPKQTSPRFYIQVGSFSTLANAEKAQQMLSDKEIKSIIETRKINNKTWYRVLIGAYASKADAEQFKPTVQAIKGFEGAMIREYY